VDPVTQRDFLQKALRRWRLQHRTHGELGSRAAARGPLSSMADLVRPYVPGDDSRRIDWKATARLGDGIVRVPSPMVGLRTWLVLDHSARMQFGSTDATKVLVSKLVLLVCADLLQPEGQPIQLVRVSGSKLEFGPMVTGQPPGVATATSLRWFSESNSVPDRFPWAELKRGFLRSHHRGRILIASDFETEQSASVEALLQLRTRHEVLAWSVLDPWDWAWPPLGRVRLTDPTTGWPTIIDTDDQELRSRYQQTRRAQEDHWERTLRAAGILTLRSLTINPWGSSPGQSS